MKFLNILFFSSLFIFSSEGFILRPLRTVRTVPIPDLNRNHQETLEIQNGIISSGEDFSHKIATSLVRPLLYVNNGISSAASALPSIFAVGGAGLFFPISLSLLCSFLIFSFSIALGSSISTPIQAGALAMNQIASGITGTLVAIPISAVAGGTAQVVGAYESGRQLYAVKTAELKEYLRQYAPHFVRPLSAISGANTVLAGMTLHTVGSGVSHVGTGAKIVGQQVHSAGENARFFGQKIYEFINPSAKSEQPISTTAAPMQLPAEEFTIIELPSTTPATLSQVGVFPTESSVKSQPEIVVVPTETQASIAQPQHEVENVLVQNNAETLVNDNVISSSAPIVEDTKPEPLEQVVEDNSQVIEQVKLPEEEQILEEQNSRDKISADSINPRSVGHLPEVYALYYVR